MIIPASRYPGRTVRNSEYQWGRARNASEPGDGTGTPFDSDWLEDLWGQTQALLREAGIEPSGDPDRVTRSQFADAVVQVIAQRVGRARGRGFDLRRAVPSIFREAPSTKLLAVSDDGRSMYVRSRSAQSVVQLGLVTPGELRGGLAPDASSLQLDEPVRSIAFGRSGRAMFAVGAAVTREFELAQPWQIATATELRPIPHGGNLQIFRIFPDGLRALQVQHDAGRDRWTIRAIIPRAPWQLSEPRVAGALLVAGAVRGLDVAPDGTAMVLAIEDGEGTTTRLTSMPIEGGDPESAELQRLRVLQYESEPVTPGGASISGVVWSRRRLFVGTADGLVGQLDTVHV